MGDAIDPALLTQARNLLEACRARGLTLVTAESCTGGLVAATLTDIAGSSDVFDRGFITYSNTAKNEVIGVPTGLLKAHGAVSEHVARAMAEGALEIAGTDIAVSVTGIAGPGGSTPEKPVGLVHFAAARKDRPTLHVRREFGDRGRQKIRRLCVGEALSLIEKLL